MAVQTQANLETARRAQLRPIVDDAAELGLDEDELELYGAFKAKFDLSTLTRRAAARPEMPRLGKHPAAFDIDLDSEGQIVGLF